MNITSTKVYGLEESIVASGFPMYEAPPTEDVFEQLVFDVMMDLEYGKKDKCPAFKRACKLGGSKPAEGHDQFLTGIVVQFNLEIPVKVWTEAERYHFLDFVSSMSTMHRLKSFNISESMDKYVDPTITKRVQELQEIYNNNPTEDNLLTLLLSAPVGTNLMARMTTNYRQLKTIRKQRKSHRLPHWHEFCDWCDGLPYFKELTGVQPKNEY